MKEKLKKLLMTCMMLVLSLCLIPTDADKVLAAKAPTASFTSYYVGAPNEGFKPGNGKKMSVKVKYKLKKAGFKGTCRVRFRVLDSNGKYVYMKLWTIKKNGSKTITLQPVRSDASLLLPAVGFLRSFPPQLHVRSIAASQTH